jgi:SAM-dependent methyltransferase
MINMQAINDATELCLQQGVRVLNPFLLGETETDHAMRLLELLAPKEGAVVLDAGCGVGELALLMSKARPDLQFKLLNASQAQLDQCPPEMERICADYAQMPLPDASVDVVMFAFSLCHADDWLTALREAFRVLRHDGVVFIFDMVRIHDGGSNTLMQERFWSMAFRPSQILDVAQRAGLQLVESNDALGHEPKVYRLRDLMRADTLAYDAAFDGVAAATFKLHRMPFAPPIASAFARHERIAFQFSGGRDSWAAAWLLKPYWDRIDWYHLDTGDQFPETQESVERFEQMVGKPLLRIVTDVRQLREQHGLPSDLVPVDNIPVGRMVSGRVVRIQGRYECCSRALMQPMHQRMLADGITLIIRGQRDDEYDVPPLRSGEVQSGIEMLYPIQHLRAGDVDNLVRLHELPAPPFYARGMKRAPECMGCSAWWDEGRAAYLKQYHPTATEGRRNVLLVRGEIARQMAQLEG